MEKITFNKEYNNLKFNIYKIEVGVIWNKEDAQEEYECYNKVYDKEHAYYDENVAFALDYNKALEYAKSYVESGVNGTYAIISKLRYNSQELYGDDIEMAMKDINSILGNGFIDNDYVNMFGSELYSIDNVVYSLYKTKDKDHPYYNGKGNGKIIENFVKTREQKIVDFMFDNDYINASEYDHWFEEDIIGVDQKIVLLYLTLEDMRKLHLSNEEELQKQIEKILVK